MYKGTTNKAIHFIRDSDTLITLLILQQRYYLFLALIYLETQLQSSFITWLTPLLPFRPRFAGIFSAPLNLAW